MSDEVCPKCGSPLGEIQETPTGKKLQRCSTGFWNKETKKNEGCDYVKWIEMAPQELDEKCPKCGSPLVLAFTRFGKKMKKCSTGGWDSASKQATGCDYVEWINGTIEPLDIPCPTCGEKLVLYTTAAGKKMEKCSTAGWDSANKKPTGCTYVRWLKPGEVPVSNAGEEFLPPEPKEN
jgi:ssDNA-binding Zn-finger/Zn-ribbon topoisomerase 1